MTGGRHTSEGAVGGLAACPLNESWSRMRQINRETFMPNKLGK